MKYSIAIAILIIITSLNAIAQSGNLTNALDDYSIDLYQKVKVDNDNLFFSPLSTYFALLTAYEGAGTATKNEFAKVLHFNDPNILNDFKSFSDNLTTWGDSSNHLTIANAIWIKNNLAIDSTYRNKIMRKYSTDIKSIDFTANQSASNEINKWVSDKTNGLIKNMITADQINNDTRIIISNAIYFLANWENKFEKELTKSDHFFSISKEKVKVDFMHKTEYLSYFENENLQFISKPYEGGDKSFCILLPRKKYGISQIEAKLDNTLLRNIFNNSSTTEVKLSIPKYKLETSYSLTDPLQKLGLKLVFTPQADFTGITKNEPLMINNINHKAYFEIDEIMTKAAAATEADMLMGCIRLHKSQPKVFKADHPFIFLIIDNKTRGILFMGRYVKPSIN